MSREIGGHTPLREACLATVAEGRVRYVFAPYGKRTPFYTVEPYGGAPAPTTYRWLFDNGLIRRDVVSGGKAKVVLTKLGEEVNRGDVYWKPGAKK